MLITDLSELGELIRRRRTELDLSQTELAEQVGATRQWVSRLENGKNDISAQRLLSVIDALDLNLDVRAPRTATPTATDLDTILPAAVVRAITDHASLAQNLVWPNAGTTDAINGLVQNIAGMPGIQDASGHFRSAAVSHFDTAELSKLAADIVTKQLSPPKEEKRAIAPPAAGDDDA